MDGFSWLFLSPVAFPLKTHLAHTDRDKQMLSHQKNKMSADIRSFLVRGLMFNSNPCYIWSIRSTIKVCSSVWFLVNPERDMKSLCCSWFLSLMCTFILITDFLIEITMWQSNSMIIEKRGHHCSLCFIFVKISVTNFERHDEDGPSVCMTACVFI